ncbi:MAG: porin family protein [Flavobacteriales bacterium]
MRKYILLFAWICGLTTAGAQNIDMGVKVGFSSTQIDNLLDSKSRSGFLGGLFVTLKTGDTFAIQPELLFTQSGGEFDFGRIRLDNLSIPIVFKYEIFSPLSLVAGPIFNFKLHDHISFREGYAAVKGQIARRGFVLDSGFGVALDLPLGFRVDLRYIMGLSNALKNKSGDLSGFSARGKSKGWQITVEL